MELRRRCCFDARMRISTLLACCLLPVLPSCVVAAVAAVRGFLDLEPLADFLLQAEFPLPGSGGVIFPEAAVGDSE